MAVRNLEAIFNYLDFSVMSQLQYQVELSQTPNLLVFVTIHCLGTVNTLLHTIHITAVKETTD